MLKSKNYPCKLQKNFLKLVMLLVIFLITERSVFSQMEFFKMNQISANYLHGYISDQKKVNRSVISNYINGISLSLSQTPNGSKNWHDYFNFPEMGYNLIMLDLGNSDQLGYLFAISRYVDFNITNIKNIDIDLRSALGTAIPTKIFNPIENHKNIFLSKRVNFFFEFNVSAEVPLLKSKNIYLNTGISLMHASNGETKMPNGGISMYSYFLGISKKEIGEIKNKPNNGKSKNDKFIFTICPTIGWKENWQWGNDKYIELSVSSDVLYKLNRKQLIGLGIEVFYDETRKIYSNHNTEPVSTNKESTIGGMHFTHQINMYPLSIVFKAGINVIKSKNVQSKNYNLVGVRYNLNEWFYLCMYHKSHSFFYGDNIQWGIGVTL